MSKKDIPSVVDFEISYLNFSRSEASPSLKEVPTGCLLVCSLTPNTNHPYCWFFKLASLLIAEKY